MPNSEVNYSGLLSFRRDILGPGSVLNTIYRCTVTGMYVYTSVPLPAITVTGMYVPVYNSTECQELATTAVAYTTDSH